MYIDLRITIETREYHYILILNSIIFFLPSIAGVVHLSNFCVASPGRPEY